MRTKWLGPVLAVLATGMLVASAPAQTIAYTNFLRFDLQSYRSQATGGMFDDDIEMVSDAAKLMNIEGNRLFTSFSNLADPAGFGDNVLSYSVDHLGVPGGSDHFDTGSYLVGWIGKYDKDSEYNMSVFYQRNSGKAMFEDLEDGNLGTGTAAGTFDAQYTGSRTVTTYFGSTVQDSILGDVTTNWDLQRYDERSATDFDLGVARDVSEDLSVGGRVFFEKDQVNSFADGIMETVTRGDVDPTLANGTQLAVTRRVTQEYKGNGEEAFKYREMGVSLDSNYHAWEDQSVGFRLDIFGASETNPGTFSPAAPSTRAQPTGPFNDGWTRVNLRTQTINDIVRGAPHGGGATVGGAALAADHFTRDWDTFTFGYPGYTPTAGGAAPLPAIESVDDTRDGIGFNGKGEYNREWGGGMINSWVGGGYRKLDISATQVAVDRHGFSTWWSDDGANDYEALNTTLDQTLTTKRSGDTTMKMMEVGGRWNRDLNSNVSIGLGAVLSRDTSTDDYRQTDDNVVITDAFDDGNSGPNALFAIAGAAYNERSTTATTTDITDVKDETKATYLRLPVGTQFHFRKRWTFNMGAQHMLMNTTRDVDVTVPAGGDGKTTTTVYSESAGTTTTTYDNSGTTRATTVTKKSRSNHTTYWYGLSVMITDAVQLDINGFLDSDSFDGTLDRGLPTPNFTSGGSFGDVEFWRNLAISMKYIFW